jgi:hypothetical protein
MERTIEQITDELAVHHKKKDDLFVQCKAEIAAIENLKSECKKIQDELHFREMPMPPGDDWFRTVPIGKLSQIMDDTNSIWCPTCRGSGLEREGGFFRKEILCPRCRGHMIIPAGSVTEEEFRKLSVFEKEKVKKNER